MSTCVCARGDRNVVTDWITSARLLSASGVVRTRPLSHFSHSESQLATSEVGHTMMTRFAAGDPPPSMPCRRSVHSSVMACSVLPRPWEVAARAWARQRARGV